MGRKMAAPGAKYRSSNRIFAIVVPPITGFDSPTWRAFDDCRKGDHEAVMLRVVDFGEMYRAGVVFEPAGEVDLDTIAPQLMISDKSQIGAPLESIEETHVSTQFGDATLRLYSIKGGSLIVTTALGQKRQKPESHDSYIALLVVRQPGRILFVAAQDDYVGIIDKTADDAWKQALKAQAQALFATMTLGK
ncbi:MAG: hypothetical protein WBF06_09735, partial [Candidatus Acidiferrales bacterium]